MKNYEESSRELTVYDNVDVVVVGGGIAGVIEAIKAARNGEKVVLCEQYAVLGGYLTSGGHPKLGSGIIKDKKCDLLVEIFDNIINDEGTRYQNIDELFNDANEEFLVDPEVVNVVLMDMCVKAHVELNMLTLYCGPIKENDTAKGVILQNKSGRYAVLAKRIVDATGSGKVAVTFGEENKNEAQFDQAEQYGIPERIGHVDLKKFVDYIVNKETKPSPEFVSWLEEKTKKTRDELLQDDYYKYFLAPATYLGVPFDKDYQDKAKAEFDADGRLTNVGIQFFGDVLMQADKAGDLEFEPKVGDVTMRFNLEGFSFETWRHGEVVANIVACKEAFIEEDSAIEADLETYTRRRALDVQNMIKKYIPGFEKSYLISTAAKTYSANVRVITSNKTKCLDNRRDYDYLFRERK